MEEDEDSVEFLWCYFKSAIRKAGEVLPEKSKRQERDWVTDELRNLSKRNAQCGCVYVEMDLVALMK